ncbi:MAG: phosphodiesterase [Treponemataceae bacterium]|nr:phosphodiesterase [Treponemataceae bacterium]
MKLFIVSDIHGSVPAFEKALAAFEKEQADYLVICGDYLNHGPRNDLPEGYDTKKLAPMLNTYKDVIIGVRGNCDSEVDQMVLDFPVLAPYAHILLPCGKRVFVHHGHIYTEEQAAELCTPGTVIVSGHTHVSLLKTEEMCGKGEYTFMNPGSVSIPKGGTKAGYAVIESDSEKITRMELVSF